MRSAGSRKHRPGFIRDNWGFLLFIVLMLTMRSSLADWYDVPTGSMQPTIVEGDRIFVNKAAYYLEVPFTNIRVMHTGKVKRGDIVIIDSDHEDMRLVKRVVGLPGDCISMQNNVLTVNGETLTYRRQNPQTYEETLDNSRHLIQLRAVPAAKHSFSATYIPDKQLMVLGDNRNNSRDSRFIGFVSLSEIQGKATSVLFSLDPDDHYLPRPARTLRQLM